MAQIAFLALVCCVMSVSTLEWNPSTGFQRFRRQRAAWRPGCLLPEALQNGRYWNSPWRCPAGHNTRACQMIPGTYVPEGWIIHFSCNDGYQLNQNIPLAACLRGAWAVELPVCNPPIRCPPLSNYEVDITCTSGSHNVSCAQPMIPGTTAALKCKEGYQVPSQSETSQLTCLDSGAWNFQAFNCTPAPTPGGAQILARQTELAPHVS